MVPCNKKAEPMNTLKIYYHEERGFLYSENWPVYPTKPGPMSHQEFFTEYYEDDIPAYNKALVKAIEQAIEFEDQDFIRGIVGGPAPINTGLFYEIPLQGVEVVEVLSPGWVPSYNDPSNIGGAHNAEPMLVARLLPSTPDPVKEESQDIEFELWDIVEWVADRFGEEYPGSSVGIMGTKAVKLMERKKGK
jgi:hypothetical protein